VHRVRACACEQNDQADRDLLLFFRLRLGSVGDVFTRNVFSSPAD